MASKLEADWKKEIVDAIRAAGGYATRIEDQYRVGFLDLILCMPSTGIVLAEAKRFTGTFYEPSARQYIEMCAVDDGGGTALLIGVKDGWYHLHGTNRDDHPRGRAWAQYSYRGTDFPALFQQWYKEVVSDSEKR